MRNPLLIKEEVVVDKGERWTARSRSSFCGYCIKSQLTVLPHTVIGFSPPGISTSTVGGAIGVVVFGSDQGLVGQLLFLKVLSNFRGNLTIRHLVNCFNTYDAFTNFVSL